MNMKGGRRGGGQGGRGRGRGGGRDGGSGGGSGGDDNRINFAGRGPKTFDQNHQKHNHSAGRGPKHFGNQRARPDRVLPVPVGMESDDEDDVDDATGLGGMVAVEGSKDEESNANTSTNVKSTSSTTNTSTSTRKHHQYCLICYSSTLPSHRTITPCGHDDVCAPCHLRLRHLHSDKKCPICKTSNESLIVDEDNTNVDEEDAMDGEVVHHRRFGGYEVWGDQIMNAGNGGGGFVFREDVGMFFRKEYCEKVVEPLFGFGCGLMGCGFSNVGDLYVNQKEGDNNSNTAGNNNNDKPAQREIKKRLTGLPALKNHLRTSHGMTLCDLCITHKRDFISRLPRFTPSGLKSHQSKGDGDQTGFTGHPLCEFCRPLRFYDIVKLHEHLNKEHYKCHICERKNKPNQFFKDYDKLEWHFDREHFLCHDAQCLAARFVVFENEIDLRGHEGSVHGMRGGRNGGTKIQLEFRVRREGEQLERQSVPTEGDFQFGLNGEAFVPEALPGENQQRQANEPMISDPVHAARTAELRAMAARVREQNGTGPSGSTAVEAFPALGQTAASAITASSATASSTASTGGFVGWTADGPQSSGTSAFSASRLKKNPVGKVTEEDFPSLGGQKKPAPQQYQMLTTLKKPQSTARTVSNFSAVASRPTEPRLGGSAISAPSATMASYASPMPVAARAPDLSSQNFPSLGGATPSPYASANALSKKLAATNNARGVVGAPPMSSSAFPSLSSTSDFPPPPSTTTKKPNIATALAPKKPPPQMALDNVLQFPPPSATSSTASSTTTSNISSLTPLQSKPKANLSTSKNSQNLTAGKETLASLKDHLGSIRYKKLKSLTKSFASEDTSPDTFVEESASLFDNGVGDAAFWEFVPDLIRSCPNQEGVEKALNCLEGLRVANEIQTREFGGSAMATRTSKPIKYVLPKKKGNSWGNNPSIQTRNAKNVEAAQLSAQMEALDVKPSASSGGNVGGGNAGNASGGGKKSKSKKKNNELKALAFGL